MVRIGALTLGVALGLAAPASAADQKVDIRFAAVAGDAPGGLRAGRSRARDDQQRRSWPTSASSSPT